MLTLGSLGRRALFLYFRGRMAVSGIDATYLHSEGRLEATSDPLLAGSTFLASKERG